MEEDCSGVCLQKYVINLLTQKYLHCYFCGNAKGSMTSEKPKEMHGWIMSKSSSEIVQNKSFLWIPAWTSRNSVSWLKIEITKPKSTATY